MQLVQIFRFCLTFCFGCLLQLNIDLHSRFVSSITMCLICFWFLNWMLFDYSNSFCLLYFSRTKKKCVSAGCFLFLFLQLVIVTLWWLVLFAFIGFVLVLISGKECIFLCFWLDTSVTQLCCDILCVCVLCVGMRGTLTYAVLSLAVMNYCLYIVDCNVWKSEKKPIVFWSLRLRNDYVCVE